jgi:prolyl-tRNA editing enzyme YbaK/EbsC (Cys-tRNA(Pro) deacylase)
MGEPEEIEAAVRAELDRLGARYEWMACDPDFADTAAFCARYGVDPADSANAILVAARKDPTVRSLCLVLATTKLDVNHKVSELMGVKKLSFASAEETRAATGMLIGGVTPFGLPFPMPIYVDRRVLGRPTVVIGGGSRSSKVRVAPEVFGRLPGCQVIDGLAMDREAAPSA